MAKSEMARDNQQGGGYPASVFSAADWAAHQPDFQKLAKQHWYIDMEQPVL